MLFCHVVITVSACTFVTCTLIKINQDQSINMPTLALQARQTAFSSHHSVDAATCTISGSSRHDNYANCTEAFKDCSRSFAAFIHQQLISIVSKWMSTEQVRR